MSQQYNTVVNALEQFSANHLSLKRFKCSFFEQMDNFSTSENSFPILYAIPNDISFEYNIDVMSFRVYCVDVLQKDRSNEQVILNETLLILRDLNNWFKQNNYNNLNVLNNPRAIPVNNFLTEFTTGWYIDIDVEVEGETNDCSIPFSNNFILTGITCDTQYVNQFLTCDTLLSCDGFIDLDNRVTTLESIVYTITGAPLTFSGTSNYYSRFTSGGTLSNGIIWDDGISIVNFMGTEDTAINIVSPVGYYYPSLKFYNNGGNPTGSITGYDNELYINGGLKVHPNYINLPYHTPNTLLYTNANNYVLPVTIGSNLSFSTGGTLSVTGLTSGMIFTGGTVTGSTNFTNGVTANTYTVNQLYGLTAQTAQTVNLELTDQYEYTLTGNTTFTFSNNLNGKSWMVAVKSNPTTSGYTSSFTASTANVKWAYGITPVQTATANKTDIYSFIQLNGVIYGDYSQSY